eukprot:9212531-Lingulodinium_polyedra.AAC.1
MRWRPRSWPLKPSTSRPRRPHAGGAAKGGMAGSRTPLRTARGACISGSARAARRPPASCLTPRPWRRTAGKARSKSETAVGSWP